MCCSSNNRLVVRTQQGRDNFKKGSLVFIDYSDDYQISCKYKVKRGPIYEISKVDTTQRPFLYKLRDPHSEKEAYGWYYGRELVRADLSQIHPTTSLWAGRCLGDGS